ncbi:hypothetical protein GCM10023148_21610 [Actinokineospora soli]
MAAAAVALLGGGGTAVYLAVASGTASDAAPPTSTAPPTTTTSAAPSTTSGVSLLSAEETVQAYVEEINKRDKAAVIKVVCGGKQPGTQFADVTRDRGVVTITGEIDISSWAQVGYVDAAAEYPNAAKPVEFSIEVENGPKGWCIDPD